MHEEGQSPLYEIRSINPEDVSPTGDLTAKEVYELFKFLSRKYQRCVINHEASGQHQPDFFPYCGNDLDVFCLHLKLKQ